MYVKDFDGYTPLALLSEDRRHFKSEPSELCIHICKKKNVEISRPHPASVACSMFAHGKSLETRLVGKACQKVFQQDTDVKQSPIVSHLYLLIIAAKFFFSHVKLSWLVSTAKCSLSTVFVHVVEFSSVICYQDTEANDVNSVPFA